MIYNKVIDWWPFTSAGQYIGGSMKFEVTEQEANLILQALAELPAKFSMQLLAKLQMQAKEQGPK